MRGLQIFRSQVKRQPTGGGGMIDPSVARTGESQYIQKAADDVSRAADTISGNLFKIATAEAYSQLSTATRKREEDFNNTILAIEQEPDLTKHEKLYSDFQIRAKALGEGLPGLASRQWQQDMDERAPAYQNRFSNLDYAKRKNAVIQDNTANWEAAVKDRDEITLRRVAQGNIEAGLWTKEFAANEITKASREIAVSHVQDVLSEKIISGGMTAKEAMDLLGKEEFSIDTKEGDRKVYRIDSDTRAGMAREILFWDNQRKQEAAIEQKTAFDNGDKEAFLSFTGNSLSYSKLDDMVKANQLTTQDAWHYRQALKGEESKAQEMQRISGEAAVEAAKTDLGQQLFAALQAGSLDEEAITKLVGTDKVLSAEEGNKWKGWIKDMKKAGPAETDQAALWDLKEQIHGVKMGQTDPAKVKKAVRRATLIDKTLSAQDAEQLQNDLNGAIESAGKSENPEGDNLKSAGMQLLGRAFTDGIYGDKNDSDSAMLYGQRMGQWEKFWKANPKATPPQAQEFLSNLMAANVIHKWRDILPFVSAQGRREKYESKINAELGRFAAEKTVQGFALDSTEKADENEYQPGQTMEKDGVIYTYQGDGKWEY
jgi:hypothetical protein